MNQPSNPEVERIVRLVVARLSQQNAVSSAATVGSSAVATVLEEQQTSVLGEPQSAAESTTAEQTAGALHLSNRIVTLNDLKDRLTGVHKLHVGPKTVVTPAVCDLLRRLEIALVRSSGHTTSRDSAAGPKNGQAFIVIANPEKLQSISALAKQPLSLFPAGAAIDQVALQLSQQLESNSQSVWLSTHPFAVQIACGAKSSPALRAVSLHASTDLPRAMAEARPNLLILDDSRWSAYQVAKLIQSWTHSKH
ncbi:MAG: hypothetical protein KF752_07970 [Pirellulaceae bacterium]|nr:hypothetical protein [Pirellulaceae bacterium]